MLKIKCKFMNNEIFINRRLGQLGLDLYFYNIRTLMIFEYEVLYQVTEGLWSTNRYPVDHSTPWVDANLHLTSGKNNARNVVEIGCNIIKNDYNLKKILNLPTSYERVKSIGKMVNYLGDDVDTMKVFFNEGFHEYASLLEDEYSDENYNEFLSQIPSKKLAMSLSPEIIEGYLQTEYTFDEMKDDLGMIQNTMRNTTTLQY